MNDADLTGYKLIVTRPGKAGETLCDLIEKLGGKAIYFPTIAFVKPVDDVALLQAIHELSQVQWLIFISVQSVRASFPLLKQIWPQFPAHWKFAAVGAATKQALEQVGCVVSLYPEKKWNSEALLALPPFQQVAQQSIAIFRGEGGRLLLDTELAARQAKVLPVVSYRRVCPDAIWDDTKASLQNVNAILCYSLEGAQNFKKILNKQQWQVAKTIPLAVLSERIKLFASKLGFQTIWVMPNADTNTQLVVLSQNIRNFLYER